MTALMRKMALAGLLALAAGGAGAAVTVTYVQPEKFTDLPFASWEREHALKDLSEHFTQLGKGLAPGQDLRIEVLDIDLAGRPDPRVATTRDVRILRGGADWPRMQLRFTLEQNGRTIKSGEARLTDMDYLARHNRYFDNVSLRYDKQMIDDWYEKTIGPLPRNARH